jgi:hypothetical protein
MGGDPDFPQQRFRGPIGHRVETSEACSKSKDRGVVT